MILFKKIRWKNLLSTGNTFTEIDLTKTNLTLIVGDNGAGKSTILDALCFGLFNKPFRKVNKPQLINTINNKDCLVEIEFSIGSTEYKVVRGMKPNVFEVYKDEKLLNQSADKRDYQEILENQILKLNFKSFCQVVILGSASYVPFMQLPTGERRKIIEDLLDLQIFSQMNAVLKERVSKNKEDILTFSLEKKSIEDKIEIVKMHIKATQDTNQKVLLEKKEILVDAMDQIKTKKLEKTKVLGIIAELKASITHEETVSNRIHKLDGLKHRIEAKLRLMKDEVSFFNDNDNCPTCKQLIDETFKATAVGSREQQIQEINEGLTKLTEEYSAQTAKLQEIMDIQSKIADANLEVHHIEIKIESLESYCKQIEDELSKIIEVKSDSEDKTRLNKLNEDLQSNIVNYNDASEMAKVYSVASSLLKDDGIKSRIVKQYIPIINKLINKYLAAMDFFVNFELDENFSETIKSRHRDEFSYASFSEGEKMRINLAVLFTWRTISKMRNSASTNLLIMDEVLDGSLDSNGTDEFLKILNGLVQDTNTYIISHKTDTLYDKFTSVMKFEKSKNFSRLTA